MRVGAVICEYNPFHNGHKYMLDCMKNDGCDAVIAVMSGSFTQRGDVAVYSKFQRAEAALVGGADLIIELPAVRAVASAQRFAKGGCDIVKALRCVDALYFGSECGNAELIAKAAYATKDEKVNRLLKEKLNQGEYYPSALKDAVGEVFGEDIAEVIASPNNTLGVEYTKELSTSGIEIKTVKRVGAEHDSKETSENFASASQIRNMIKGGEAPEKYLFGGEKLQNPAFSEYGERAVLLSLRSMSLEEMRNIPDVSEGLENRISEAAKKENSLENILAAVKTKRYTMARLRRIIICAVLGITKAMQEERLPYVRVLGLSKKGEELLKTMKTRCELPIIVNVAKDYQNLSPEAKIIFDTDIRATDTRTVFENSPSPCLSDFTSKLIKI